MASVVTSMVLMGEGDECFLASRKSGQKRANELGEDSLSVFLPLTASGNWASVGEPTCHICGQ